MIGETPFWAISIAYWLHMLATVIWIGGMATLTIVILPAARAAIPDEAYPAFLGRLRRRLDPLSWISLIVLLATGMFQMSANPNYVGFLAVENRWAAAILIKHLVFGGMIAVSAYQTWGLLPALNRALLRLSSGKGKPGERARLEQRETLLLRVNFALSVLVLALTALARAA